MTIGESVGREEMIPPIITTIRASIEEDVEKRETLSNLAG
jgi:hypothetical protein